MDMASNFFNSLDLGDDCWMKDEFEASKEEHNDLENMVKNMSSI